MAARGVAPSELGNEESRAQFSGSAFPHGYSLHSQLVEASGRGQARWPQESGGGRKACSPFCSAFQPMRIVGGAEAPAA